MQISCNYSSTQNNFSAALLALCSLSLGDYIGTNIKFSYFMSNFYMICSADVPKQVEIYRLLTRSIVFFLFLAEDAIPHRVIVSNCVRIVQT